MLKRNLHRIYLVEKFPVSKLPESTLTPPVNTLVRTNSKTVKAPSSNQSNFLVFEKTHLSWFQKALGVPHPALPFIIHICAAKPRPHLALCVKYKCVKIPALNGFNL